MSREEHTEYEVASAERLETEATDRSERTEAVERLLRAGLIQTLFWQT